jgi:alkylation response protein AidB-like acyl-CoA dehydrogenase
MDFSIPKAEAGEVARFVGLLNGPFGSRLTQWFRQRELPRAFFSELGTGGWYGFEFEGGRIRRRSAFRQALITEEFAKVSPGAAVAALAHADLGLMALALFGSEALQSRFGPAAVAGQAVMCLGSTERQAGSDAAGIALAARPAPGGWKLSGAKAYVTNGAAADRAVVTAVTDPEAPRSGRISMFLADLNADGVRRTRLNKQVWLPSDLTRIEFGDVFVPADRLLGSKGRGLQQVLAVFAHSRLPIAALAIGTAAGALDLAVRHALRRSAFGRRIAEHQAKAFEIAEHHAALEAARLVLWKACSRSDRGEEFREHSSMAKFLAVAAARRITAWAADLFGAASVVHEHPVHKYPLDAWAASLGEGTQDIQKLIIFREVMKRYAP